MATDSIINHIDGRTARRERGRLAVIDAVFELLQEGQVPPDVEEIAQRSGVSVSSIFRYFDGLEDLQVQTLHRFKDRFGHLFLVEGSPAAPLEDRVSQFVDARLTMLNEVGGILAVARLRSIELKAVDAAVQTMRKQLAEQVQKQFSFELNELTFAKRAALISVVDSFTSPAAWDVMRLSHGCTRRQIRSAWVLGLEAIFAAWKPNQMSNTATEKARH